jgi:DNA-binding Xre family transcriptional regulator
MQDEERFKLLFGPYQAPPVNIGDEIVDEVRGPVIIGTWSKGRIPWPCLRTSGRSAFVLCGDLARAVRHESSLAIQYWWGVGPATVHRWRRQLGIGNRTEGTIHLHRAWQPQKLSPSVAARGRQKSIGTASRAKMSQTVRARGYYHRDQRIWTPEEEALLGTMPDREVAERLNRSLKLVGMWRRKRGIPPFRVQHHTHKERNTVAISPEKILTRRLQLHLSQKEVAQRAHLNQAHLSQMESGFWHRVRPETIQRLTQALECQIGDLMAG